MCLVTWNHVRCMEMIRLPASRILRHNISSLFVSGLGSETIGCRFDFGC